MKKIGILLCLSSTLFAAAAAQAGCCENGNWLVGVSGGWAWHSDRDATVTIQHPAPGSEITSYQLGNDDSSSKFIWGLLAGYQARVNGWLLGGEVNVDWRKHNDDARGFTVDDPVDGIITGSVNGNSGHNAVVGLTGRIGYEVSPYFLPYIRLGAEVTRTENRDFVVTAPGVPYTVTSSNDRNHRWGFIGGLGAEFPVPVCKTLSLRAEYNYHSHSRHDDVAVLASDLATLYTVSGDGNRHENTGKLALVYNFL
jgi:opacity protein-like surface antigen